MDLSFDDLIPKQQTRGETGAPSFDDLIPKQGDTAHAQAASSTLPDVAKSVGVGLVKGVNAIIGAPGNLQSLVHEGVGYVGGKLGLPESPNAAPFKTTLPTSSDIQRTQERVTGPFYEPQTTAGKYAETIGEFLPGAVAMPGSLGSRAANAVRFGVIPGAMSEAGGQLTKGTSAEPWARAGGGMLGSLVGPAIMNAPGRIISPLPTTPERQAMVGTLRKEGVPLTAGQATGSKPLKWAESTLADMPFAGGKAAEIERAQKEAFTSAALKRAGLPGPRATPDALSAGRDELSRKFEQLSQRNTLRMDQQFGQDLTATLTNYENLVPASARAPGVHGLANDLLGRAVQTGAIPGDAYQSIRSRLTNRAQSLRMSDPPQAEAYRGIRDALDSAMDRSIRPQDAGAWGKLRRQYGNYKAVEKAAGAAGESAAEGLVSPAQLRGAIAGGNNRAGYARGEGDLAELTRAGVGVMSPLPQSGTAPRQLIQGAVTGGATVAGGLPGLAASVAGPALAGRALMSPAVQGYLANQVAPRAGLISTPAPGARMASAGLGGNIAAADYERNSGKTAYTTLLSGLRKKGALNADDRVIDRLSEMLSTGSQDEQQRALAVLTNRLSKKKRN